VTYTARDTEICVSITPKICFQKSDYVCGLWRHFLSYCRLTKSLSKLFLMCHIVYFNNVNRNLWHLSCTRGPPQPVA